MAVTGNYTVTVGRFACMYCVNSEKWLVLRKVGLDCERE